ncbi:unnamed protein product [Choristocarpus tenellus]
MLLNTPSMCVWYSSHDCSSTGSWSAGGRQSAAAAAAMKRAGAVQTGVSTSARRPTVREKVAARKTAATTATTSYQDTVRGTADRRCIGGGVEQVRVGGVVTSGGGGDGIGQEVCPQCGASFGDVAALVAHVDDFHSHVRCVNSLELQYHNQQQEEGKQARAGSGRGAGEGQGGSCPFCEVVISDPTELVAHVESFHSGNNHWGGSDQNRERNCRVS